MYKQIVLYILFTLLVPKNGIPQPQITIDSLQNELLNSPTNTHNIFYKLGQNYFYLGQYEIAMKYQIKALNYISDHKIKSTKAPIYNEIGNIYLEHQNNYIK